MSDGFIVSGPPFRGNIPVQNYDGGSSDEETSSKKSAMSRYVRVCALPVTRPFSIGVVCAVCRGRS
jgi:hypothetical protein